MAPPRATVASCWMSQVQPGLAGEVQQRAVAGHEEAEQRQVGFGIDQGLSADGQCERFRRGQWRQRPHSAAVVEDETAHRCT